MNRITYVLVFILLMACNYIEPKKLNANDLFNEELQSFNWNEIDTYPTFSTCDSLTTKMASRECFQNTLVWHVNTYLKKQDIVVSQDIRDTIRLQLGINKTGALSLNSVIIRPETTVQIPQIDSLLRQSLNAIPKLYPAIKRGQQVNTAFELPIIVQIN